jgi:hypothetical protein
MAGVIHRVGPGEVLVPVRIAVQVGIAVSVLSPGVAPVEDLPPVGEPILVAVGVCQ